MLLWRKRKRAQEGKWLRTNEDCTALCAALNCSVMASSFNILNAKSKRNTRGLRLKWRMNFWALIIIRRVQRVRSSAILEPRLFTKASLSISALISRTTATGNWIPVDETLKSTSLEYDCSTDSPLDMDNSFFHSSGIPSKLCHQEKGNEPHKLLRKMAKRRA